MHQDLRQSAEKKPKEIRLSISIILPARTEFLRTTAIAGAFAGYHMRKRLSRDKPNLGVAVLEDALAIGGGILIVALAAPLRT